jgi:hypothetical protein
MGTAMTPEQMAAVDKLIASVADGSFEHPRGPDITLPDGSYAYAFRRDDGSISWEICERYLGPRIAGGTPA